MLLPLVLVLVVLVLGGRAQDEDPSQKFWLDQSSTCLAPLLKRMPLVPSAWFACRTGKPLALSTFSWLVSSWFTLPRHSPPLITTNEVFPFSNELVAFEFRALTARRLPPSISCRIMCQELHARRPFVAPILYGGLGNMLFQLATMHRLAWDLDIDCVVGYWDHWNRKHLGFNPWGGHTKPAPVTLKDTFPNLPNYFDFEPEQIVVPGMIWNHFAFELQYPDQWLDLPTRADIERAPFVHGYFFNHRYWHPFREKLLDLFAVHPAIQDYVRLFYGAYFRNPEMETVSVHLRLGYPGEPSPTGLAARTFPQLSWFRHVITTRFDSSRTKYVFLVFSDNVELAREALKPLQENGAHITIIEENIVATLHLMSICKHHILTSSTIAFWGAYLDRSLRAFRVSVFRICLDLRSALPPRSSSHHRAQPHGGRTYIHPSLYTDHGREMIPYAEWILVPDP
eukprot:m.144166 g.144166  ORF g.144166 m.144166 type:complete len:454 (-) comp52656_c0_seq17:42-1403(-)